MESQLQLCLVIELGLECRDGFEAVHAYGVVETIDCHFRNLLTRPRLFSFLPYAEPRKGTLGLHGRTNISEAGSTLTSRRSVGGNSVPSTWMGWGVCASIMISRPGCTSRR